MSPLPAAGWLVLSLIASVGVAHTLHLAIESPAMRFSRRFKGFPARPNARAGSVRPIPLLAESAR